MQVFSEIGQLKKVLLHRPGKELEHLVPEELERLLFDDIPYLKTAQEEHDAFARTLKEQGAEVVYLEDLALQGFNYLALTLGTHVMKENSQEYHDALERNRQIWLMGNRLGMKAVAGCGNDGFIDSPSELRAEPTKRSFFGTEICPSKPAGLEYIVRTQTEKFEYLRDVDFGMIHFWSYDQGGCGCASCSPYGSHGMFLWGDRMAPIIHRMWPNCQIIWATWLYDWVGAPQGEWDGLYRRIQEGKANYIKIIMADSHETFPEYPLTHPFPNGVKLFTFPEISMWGRSPWGGFGATPLPQRFAELWGETGGVATGGMLYSEGIYEDFNKVLYANFFATGNNDTQVTIQEYFNYDLGLPQSAYGDWLRFLELLQKNHAGLLWWPNDPKAPDIVEPMKSKPLWRQRNKKWFHTDEQLALAEKLEAQMPQWARKSWRWRLFHLRAIIDFEISTHDNEATARSEQAMLELCKIYLISPETATRRVTPMTDERRSAPLAENLG